MLRNTNGTHTCCAAHRPAARHILPPARHTNHMRGTYYLLRGTHTSCAAHRPHAWNILPPARHTDLLHGPVRGTQTCCAAHIPPARHIYLITDTVLHGTNFLFHAATFCSVQVFSVPRNSFLFRSRFVLMGHRRVRMVHSRRARSCHCASRTWTLHGRCSQNVGAAHARNV